MSQDQYDDDGLCVRDYVAPRDLKGAGGTRREALNVPADVPRFTVTEAGEYVIDILPYVVKNHPDKNRQPGKLWWERPYKVHKEVGPDFDQYVCPVSEGMGQCPICRKRIDDYVAINKGASIDPKLTKKLFPQDRQLFNVVDTSAYDLGVQLWDVASFLFGDDFGKRLAALKPHEEQYRYFPSPTKGFSLRLLAQEGELKGGKKNNKPYFKFTLIGFQPRRGAYDHKWLESCLCLDDIVRGSVADGAAIGAAFFAGSQDDAHEEPRQSWPAANKRTTAATPPPSDPANYATGYHQPAYDPDGYDAPLPPPPVATAAHGDTVVFRGAEYRVTRRSPDGTMLTIDNGNGGVYRVQVNDPELTAVPQPVAQQAPPRRLPQPPAPSAPAVAPPPVEEAPRAPARRSASGSAPVMHFKVRDVVLYRGQDYEIEAIRADGALICSDADGKIYPLDPTEVQMYPTQDSGRPATPPPVAEAPPRAPARQAAPAAPPADDGDMPPPPSSRRKRQ